MPEAGVRQEGILEHDDAYRAAAARAALACLARLPNAEKAAVLAELLIATQMVAPSAASPVSSPARSQRAPRGDDQEPFPAPLRRRLLEIMRLQPGASVSSLSTALHGPGGDPRSVRVRSLLARLERDGLVSHQGQGKWELAQPSDAEASTPWEALLLELAKEWRREQRRMLSVVKSAGRALTTAELVLRMGCKSGNALGGLFTALARVVVQAGIDVSDVVRREGGDFAAGPLLLAHALPWEEGGAP